MGWISKTVCGFRVIKLFYLSFVTALVGFVLFVAIAAHFSSWCLVRESDVEELCTQLIRLKDLLDSNGVKNFLCYGSLLGAYRETDNRFHHIPWEHDVDLCVEFDKKEEFTKLMHDSDLITEFWPNAVGMWGRVHIDRYYSTWRWSELWIDVFYYKRNGTAIKFRDVEMFADELEPLKWIDYCGSRFWIPNRSKIVLEQLYGDGWREEVLPTEGAKFFKCSLLRI